eukprot:g4588.t1
MQVSFRSLPSFELSPHLFPGGTNCSFFWVFSVVNKLAACLPCSNLFRCWHKSVAAKALSTSFQFVGTSWHKVDSLHERSLHIFQLLLTLLHIFPFADTYSEQ